MQTGELIKTFKNLLEFDDDGSSNEELTRLQKIENARYHLDKYIMFNIEYHIYTRVGSQNVKTLLDTTAQTASRDRTQQAPV